MILAPHPDDETLGTGGLIQRASSAGARTHIVFATNGDDNPWPQRFLERRWRLDDSDRLRWGSRRREEAGQALTALGGTQISTKFLHFADQALTPELMRGDTKFLRAFSAELARFRPTRLIIPTAHDRHPDHSALHVLARFAIDGSMTEPPQILGFSVHHPRQPLPSRHAELKLTPGELERKRAAILCHVSQVALSRRRFLAYAQETECFVLQPEAHELSPGHGISRAVCEGGVLVLTLSRTRRMPGSRVLIALQSETRGAQRWSLPLAPRKRIVRLRDEIVGVDRRKATIRPNDGEIEVRIPLAGMQPISRLFVKLEQPVVFLDAIGWREVPTVGIPAVVSALQWQEIAR